jgi:hypothetical protein
MIKLGLGLKIPDGATRYSPTTVETTVTPDGLIIITTNRAPTDPVIRDLINIMRSYGVSSDSITVISTDG